MNDKQQFAAMGEHMREIEECNPGFKVPDGWRLVPEKLTGAMEDAIYKELSAGSLYGFKGAYKSMLAAAPEYKQ